MNTSPLRTPNSQVVLCAFALFVAFSTPSMTSAAENLEDEAASKTATPPAALNLGEYSLREVRGAEGTKLRLDFTLYGTVESESLRRMERLHEKLKHRVREQVLIATRLCDTKEFQEPELLHLKRRILMRLRRALPQLAIQGLYFREFAYFVE